MDNPATLLTAIMFVTILGMAIGNLLMTCADISGGLRKPPPEAVHLSWIILLLVTMLNLFWETTAILDVAEWEFLDFLFVITGPMMYLFAVSVIVSPTPEEAPTPHGHYFGLCTRFFLMLALQEAWLIGIDLRFDVLSLGSAISGALLILFAFLAVSRNYKVHLAGNVIAWFGFVSPLLARLLSL